MFFGWEGPEREWGRGGRLFEFEFEGVGGRVGWALIRGWALIQFFCLRDGRLFEVGANSRLGAYSNKYGKSQSGYQRYESCKELILVKHFHA